MSSDSPAVRRGQTLPVYDWRPEAKAGDLTKGNSIPSNQTYSDIYNREARGGVRGGQQDGSQKKQQRKKRQDIISRQPGAQEMKREDGSQKQGSWTSVEEMGGVESKKQT